MPKRIREHEQETEHRIAFATALPSVWVIRFVEGDDYGIDGDVEIFEDGLSYPACSLPSSYEQPTRRKPQGAPASALLSGTI